VVQIVLSASRRTDIPAFYMDWFMQGIEKGRFRVRHPYTGEVRSVEAGADQVHSIVFWSKDFGPFLSGRCGERLQRRGYHLFFNFTVNSPDRRLEPRVPPLKDRLDQMGALAAHFGAASVQWRFDPICHYRSGKNGGSDNCGDWLPIADRAAECGISRCVTSFLDLYTKVRRRTDAIPGFVFVDPPLHEKAAILEKMAGRLAERGIALFTCCEPEVLAAAAPEANVRPAACIPSDLLMRLYGGRLSLRKDGGQRRAQGCGCRVSVDIGSYRDQPCGHRCLYCYAT
jgi:hypothetical protein